MSFSAKIQMNEYLFMKHNGLFQKLITLSFNPPEFCCLVFCSSLPGVFSEYHSSLFLHNTLYPERLIPQLCYFSKEHQCATSDNVVSVT